MSTLAVSDDEITMNTPEKKLCAHLDDNFERDLASRLKKLLAEIMELDKAIVNHDREQIAMEAAECSFVLMDISHIAALSLIAPRIAGGKTR